MIQPELETPLGKAEQIILYVAFLFKGITLNKKKRFDYESLRLPETSIFKWSGYQPLSRGYIVRRHDHPQLSEYMAHCLPEFKQVSHYWDKQRDMVVAKILPGEFYMTTRNISIATTLGSCISACIWDERSRIGGMNHFMLPITNKEAHEVNWGQRDKTADATRYGNFAMEHLINIILRSGGRRSNLRAKLFGGAKVLNQMSDVGQKNIDFALAYLEEEEIVIESSDIGDYFPRKVIFEPSSGRAFIKRLDNLHNDTIIRRENDYSSQIYQKEVSGDVELF